MILEKAIKQASEILKTHNISTHELDAQLMLSNIMSVKRESLITNSKETITKKIMDKYNIAIQRRLKKEPVAYITGKKEFWSEDFLVNYSTLVPRPETELLIYEIIKFFKNKKINILDIGTGSGCIGITLALEIPHSKVFAIDISEAALSIAKKNAELYNLKNIEFIKMDSSLPEIPPPL